MDIDDSGKDLDGGDDDDDDDGTDGFIFQPIKPPPAKGVVLNEPQQGERPSDPQQPTYSGKGNDVAAEGNLAIIHTTEGGLHHSEVTHALTLYTPPSITDDQPLSSSILPLH